MLRHSGRVIPAIAALSYGVIAMAAEPTTEELKAQVDALSRKVEALEARQASAVDTDATVAKILADAEKRSQLMQAEGFTAGYNKGRFTLQSADGNFSFTPTAQLQVRYVGNYRETGDDNAYEDGFEIRRMKFGFTGNVINQNVTYKFQWATIRNETSSDGDVTASGGTPILEDAWVRYRFAENFAVFGGQFEDLTSHESLVSSGKQLAVEQSMANRVLIDSISEYTQGVGTTYETEMVRLSAAYTDGFNSDNTGFRDHGFGGAAVHWGASARGELMIIGDNWKEYDDFSAIGNKSDLLVAGAGVSYSDGEDFDGTLWTIDLQYEPQAIVGLNMFAALMGNNADVSVAGAEDTDNWGYLLQAGYLLNTRWEVFARYDAVELDEELVADGDEDMLQEFTLGVNYYVNGHNAKFTADLTYLPDGAPGESALGFIAQGEGDEEVVARVQFQLML